MLKWARFVLLATLGCCAGGCAAGSEAKPVSSPDAAALVVTVKAEPKAGWHDPRNDSTYAGLLPGESRQFETVDYAQLNEIVVWVEPRNEGPAFAGATVKPLVPAESLIAATIHARWSAPSAPGDYFLRDESGVVTPIGAAGTSFQAPATGYFELMESSAPRPLARLFVVPTSHFGLAWSGRKITFANLPPGPAVVRTWHPRLPGSAANVILSAGKTSHVTARVGVNLLPDVP